MTIFVVQTVLTNPGLLYTLSREPVVKLEKCHRVGAESLRIIIQYFQANVFISFSLLKKRINVSGCTSTIKMYVLGLV